jgi:ribulose bisphosphate carboxylase small subunit
MSYTKKAVVMEAHKKCRVFSFVIQRSGENKCTDLIERKDSNASNHTQKSVVNTSTML